MRKNSLIVMLISILFLAACSGHNTTSGTDPSAAPSTEPIKALAFSGDLNTYINYTTQRVYCYEAADKTVLNLLCAVDKPYDDARMLYFEGEYVSAVADGAPTSYINEAYRIASDEIAQLYGSVLFQSEDTHRTTWLKSPVKESETWETQYMDVKHGLVDAVVYVCAAEADSVTTALRIVDETIPAEDRYTLKRTFSKRGGFISERVDALPLPHNEADGLTHTELKTFTFVSAEPYAPRSDAACLARCTNEIEAVTLLFPVDPLLPQAMLGKMKADMRHEENAKIQVEIFSRFTGEIANLEGFYIPEIIDAFKYAAAYISDSDALVSTVHEVLFENPKSEWEFRRILDLLFNQFSVALFDASLEHTVDYEALFNQGRKPVPKAGTFMGAKYFEHICRTNYIFATTLGNYNEAIPPLPGSYVSMREENEALIRALSTTPEMEAYLLLMSLDSNIFEDLFEIAGNDVQPEAHDFSSMYLDVLRTSDQLFSQMSPELKTDAIPILKRLYIHVLGDDAWFLDKYNEGITFDGTPFSVGGGEGDDYGYQVATGAIKPEVYRALSDYLADYPESAYADWLQESLKALEIHGFYYNVDLNTQLNALVPGRYTDLDTMQYRQMSDLSDYRTLHKGSISDTGDGKFPDDSIQVNSPEALISAIDSGVTIVLDPDTFIFNEFDDFQGDHVRVEEGTLTLAFLKDVTIIVPKGLGQLISNTYGAVIHMQNCDNVRIEGLRMGHLFESGCEGAVLHLENCTGITLDRCIFFGSGYNGIYASKSKDISINGSIFSGCESAGISLIDSADITIKNSIFRDNYYAALEINDTKNIVLDRISTFNHTAGEYVIDAYDSDITLKNATFNETEMSPYDEAEGSVHLVK